MLSLGIELSRAFWMAAASVAFPVGSGPPSRAAMMIARESFEKSWPRRASATPFLCLIDDHLLCPDKALLRDEVATLAEQHRFAVELGEDLDVRPGLLDSWRADEDTAKRLRIVREVDVC